MVTGTRTRSSEKLTDESLCDKDTVRRSPASQNLNKPTVHPESNPVLSNSKDVDMTREMNGSITHGSEHLANHSQYNIASVESSYTTDTLRVTQRLENEVDRQPGLCHNSGVFSNPRDSQWRQSPCDDSRKTSLVDRCRNNCLHNGDAATFCPTSVAGSEAVHSTDVSQSSTYSKSLKLSGRDCRYSEATDYCGTRSENVDLRTSDRPNYLNDSESSQKPVFDCDKVNGIRDSVLITDGMSDDIPADDDDEDDGVVFNTSDFEVINAIRSDRELPSRLLEFGEPVNCSDVLHWDVASLDSPHKVQMIDDKYTDSGAENLSLPRHMLYGDDESRRASMEPNNGVLFPSERTEASRISEAVSRHSNLVQRPSNITQTRVFSDISDDDEDGAADRALIPNCSTDTENSRLLQDKIKSSTVCAAAVDGMVNSMEIDTANRYHNGSATECDDSYEDTVRQNSGHKLAFRDVVYEKACQDVTVRRNSFMEKVSEDTSLTSLDDTTKQPEINYTVHSLTEFPACSSVTTLTKRTLGERRIRRRSRNKFGDKTILDVVARLLKTCGAFDCSGQQTDLETGTEDSEKENAEEVDGEVTLTTLSPELPAICEDEPGSPMDEAPPLLAITDLLEDDTNGGEPTQSEKRSATVGVSYDSDDAEVAMPVIEDMRSALPKEDPTKIEVCGNDEEGKSGANVERKVRKTSKPVKREMPAARKEVMEIERTRCLAIVCDQCSFSCGSEQVLHQHVKACHRTPARSKERARYVCTKCPATSDDRELFLDHLAHHPGQHVVRYYRCSHCGTDAAGMETMEEHVSGSHNGSVLRFEVVQERVTYLDNLMSCPLCDAACRWKTNFVGHLRNYHQMQQLAAHLERGSGDQRFPEKIRVHRNDVVGLADISDVEAGSGCEVSNAARSISRYRDLCETSSSFNSSLSVVVHICCRCTFSTDDINSYLEHYKSHFSTSRPTAASRATVIAEHADQEPRADQRLLEQPRGKTGGSYACHLCPFKTPKRMFYHRHMAIHERNNGMTDGYRCGYCQFAHPRVHCIKFHLGRYHGNRPTKVVRISGGIESEIFDDGQDNILEEETASYPPATSSTYTRNGNQQVSSYDSCDSVSSFSSTATASKSALPVNQKTRELANDRLKRLNEFERRLPPSMFYDEPVKCPLCSFTNAVRINLLRHLRTHRNDDEEEIANPVMDNVSTAESWQNGTSETGGHAQAATEATTAMNMHDTGVGSMSTKPRMTQQLIENHLVNVVFYIFILRYMLLICKYC